MNDFSQIFMNDFPQKAININPPNNFPQSSTNTFSQLVFTNIYSQPAPNTILKMDVDIIRGGKPEHLILYLTTEQYNNIKISKMKKMTK